jgi:uncharacterized protein YjbI with pentapeptide repeats
MLSESKRERMRCAYAIDHLKVAQMAAETDYSRQTVKARRAIIWKGSVIASSLLFLLLMIVVPAVFAAPQRQVSLFVYNAGTAVAQSTPTADATVTALTKEQLTQQIKQLQLQNDRSFWSWLWSSGGGIAPAVFAALAAVVVAFFPFRQWLGNQKEDRAKQAEERFQTVVEGLSSDKEQAKLGAAIVLRTFLQPGYEQFNEQTFELAVDILQLQPHPTDLTQPPSALSRALTGILVEVFPLARDALKAKQKEKQPSGLPLEIISQKLDAGSIQLDKANLYYADFSQAWMPDAQLRQAFLYGASLSGAQLRHAKLMKADLRWADFRNTELRGADLSEINCFVDQDYTNDDASHIDLSGANLSGAILRGANLKGAILKTYTGPSGTFPIDLSGADLSGADLTNADLSGANPEAATSLKDAKMGGVTGLTLDQLKQCKDKGAEGIDLEENVSP